MYFQYMVLYALLNAMKYKLRSSLKQSMSLGDNNINNVYKILQNIAKQKQSSS